MRLQQVFWPGEWDQGEAGADSADEVEFLDEGER